MGENRIIKKQYVQNENIIERIKIIKNIFCKALSGQKSSY